MGKKLREINSDYDYSETDQLILSTTSFAMSFPECPKVIVTALSILALSSTNSWGPDILLLMSEKGLRRIISRLKVPPNSQNRW